MRRQLSAIVVSLLFATLSVAGCGAPPAASTPSAPTELPAPAATTVQPSPVVVAPQLSGRVFRSDSDAPLVGATVSLLKHAPPDSANGSAIIAGKVVSPDLLSDPAEGDPALIVGSVSTDADGNYKFENVDAGEYRLWMELSYADEESAPCYPFSFLPPGSGDDPNIFKLLSMALTPDTRWVTMYEKDDGSVRVIATLIEPFTVGPNSIQQLDVDMVCGA